MIQLDDFILLEWRWVWNIWYQKWGNCCYQVQYCLRQSQPWPNETEMITLGPVLLGAPWDKGAWCSPLPAAWPQTSAAPFKAEPCSTHSVTSGAVGLFPFQLFAHGHQQTRQKRSVRLGRSRWHDDRQWQVRWAGGCWAAAAPPRKEEVLNECCQRRCGQVWNGVGLGGTVEWIGCIVLDVDALAWHVEVSLESLLCIEL